jgi:uncharacterized phiE125 gp8 family phage protein
MLYSLDLAGLPAGAGEAVLPLALAKQHLNVDYVDDDDLIEALRDAAVVAVEDFTGLRLTPRTGSGNRLVLRGEKLPGGTALLRLFARPVTDIVSVTYLDAENQAQSIDVADLRIVDGDGIAPVPGTEWPTDCAGELVVTFEAGLSTGTIPPALPQAARMMLATLWQFRESVTMAGAVAEIPHGFQMLCRPYRRPRI